MSSAQRFTKCKFSDFSPSVLTKPFNEYNEANILSAGLPREGGLSSPEGRLWLAQENLHVWPIAFKDAAKRRPNKWRVSKHTQAQLTALELSSIDAHDWLKNKSRLFSFSKYPIFDVKDLAYKINTRDYPKGVVHASYLSYRLIADWINEASVSIGDNLLPLYRGYFLDHGQKVQVFPWVRDTHSPSNPEAYFISYKDIVKKINEKEPSVDLADFVDFFDRVYDPHILITHPFETLVLKFFSAAIRYRVSDGELGPGGLFLWSSGDNTLKNEIVKKAILETSALDYNEFLNSLPDSDE